MKKILYLLVFLLLIGMSQAAILYNNTFENGTVSEWWNDGIAINISSDPNSPINGTRSANISWTASWNQIYVNLSGGATTENLTISLKVKENSTNYIMAFFSSAGVTGPGDLYEHSHLVTCSAAGQLNYYDTDYRNTGVSCQGNRIRNYTFIIHSFNATESKMDIRQNGTSIVNNTLSRGNAINLNGIAFGGYVTVSGSYAIDDICICTGYNNITCCDPPLGTGVGANFTSPTPADKDKDNINITINVTCNVTNATYQLWFDFNDTTPSTLIFNGTNGTWTTNISQEGNYTYIGGCVGDGVTGDNTSTRTYTLSLTLPNITILPGNEFGELTYLTTSNYSLNNSPFDSNWTVNLTLRDSIGLYAWEILIYNSTTYYVNTTNTTTMAGATEYNLSIGFNASNWSNDIYCMNITVSDSHTATAIKDYTTTATADTLAYKTAEGNDISITSKEALASSTNKAGDRYTFSFDYAKTTEPTDRTYTITSKNRIDYLPNSKYKAHFVIFTDFSNGGNWIDFEGTTGTPTVNKVSDNEYTVTFKEQTAEKTTFQSIGGLNFKYAKYCTIQNNQYTIYGYTGLAGSNTTVGFNQTTYRGTGTDIYFTSWPQTSFIINSVNYTNVLGDCQYTPSGDFVNCNISSQITLPAAGTYTSNFTGYIAFYDGASFSYSPFMLPINVTSGAWNVSNCTGNTTNVTIRILFYDEEYPTVRPPNNWSVEIVFWANESWNNWTYNHNFTNQDNYSICLQTNSTLGTSGYTTYDNPFGYLNKYIWINHTINTTAWNISAYSLNRSNLSDVRITNYDSATYDYFENSLVIMERRYLAEGLWRQVQMDKTDQYGLATFKVTEESVDYRLVFYDESGNWLKNTTILKFACTAGVCVLDSYLSTFGSVTNNNLRYIYDYNATTGLVSVYWNDTLNATSNATLYVAKRTITGDITICNTTNTSGITLVCNISNQTGTIMARFYKTASPTTSVFVEWINRIISSLGSNLGGEGLIWAFILLVVIVMVGLIHPAATIFMAIAGLVVIFALGMVSAVTLAVVILAAVMGLAIAIKMRT